MVLQFDTEQVNFFQVFEKRGFFRSTTLKSVFRQFDVDLPEIGKKNMVRQFDVDLTAPDLKKD